MTLPLKEFRKNLRMLEREVELAMASDTGCCGVSLAQCHILLEVEMRGSTSVTGLASALDLDKSTLSRAVDGMCRRGWLGRITDAENRRQQIITLTKAGQEKAASINAMCDASYGRLFSRIPSSKRKGVVESVELLAGAMRGMRKCSGCDAEGDGSPRAKAPLKRA
jgi:DNA-binding MarR family transcriptional regulator